MTLLFRSEPVDPIALSDAKRAELLDVAVSAVAIVLGIIF